VNKGGRPRIEIDPDQIAQIEKLAAVLTMEQIADFLGFSERTLRRRFDEDPEVLAAYKRGKQRAVASVATNLIQQAQSGNTTAAIFYLKTQAGWRETNRTELTGPDGGPMDVRDLTDEERKDRIYRLVEAAKQRD